MQERLRRLAPELHQRFYRRAVRRNAELGVHQFRGAEGEGAIHVGEAGATRLIYGAILTKWLTGPELFGAPSAEETDALGTCALQGAEREQEFGRVTWQNENGAMLSDTVTICASASRGAWVLPSAAFEGFLPPDN